MKTIGYAIICIIGAFIMIELLCRTVIFIYSGNGAAFLYGFGATLRYHNRTFTFYCMADRPKTRGERVIATFGGSTTFGYNFSADASSWPDELGKLLPDVEIRNFGKNGTNSDYALAQLPIANHDGRVDLVLWANFINESDILYKTDHPVFLLHRIDKTLQNYSLACWIGHKLIQYAKDRAGLTVKIPDRPIHPDTVALDNYERNLQEAYRYCKAHHIQLVIIRLPSNCSFTNDPHPFSAKLEKRMNQIAARHDIPLINVQDYYTENKIECVGIHQDLAGHRQTAKYIKSRLADLTPMVSEARALRGS